jgi:hypothetical protein
MAVVDFVFWSARGRLTASNSLKTQEEILKVIETFLRTKASVLMYFNSLFCCFFVTLERKVSSLNTSVGQACDILRLWFSSLFAAVIV